MQDYVDYSNYKLSLKENIKCFGMAVLLSVFGSWLLYQNFWGILLFIIIFPLYQKFYKEKQKEIRKQKLLLEFRDAMQSVSASLLSGYSIENAWQEAEVEMRELYGIQGYMTKELKLMNGKISMNQSVEELLYQFALRSSCEEILEFAEVFRFAKRSGGNFSKIIQNTVFHIGEKIETEREIQVMIAGKKMEQKIMNIVPVALLIYLNLTSKEFLAPLYGNIFGVCVMTGAFFAYLGAFLLAQRIIKIKI